MKKARRVFGAVVAALLLIIASVSGTLAYLTSTSDEVKNTFTVGNVAITLDEAWTNGAGHPIKQGDEAVEECEIGEAPRVTHNEYQLFPGHEYTKDPTVTVLYGSDESYLRIKVTANNWAAIKAHFITEESPAFDLATIFKDFDNDNWLRHSITENTDDTVTYEFWHKTTVSAKTEDNKLDPLFTALTIPGNWSKTEIDLFKGFELDLVADAIQADGFADADAAWAKFSTATP